MSTPLRVSVVMPSFNHARFIRQAIDSVLQQDYPAVDLLVMDGGSTDSTVQILDSYGDRLQFVSRRDRGQSDAINQGLRRVQGDIVCWLNSDDLFATDTIRTVAETFERNPDIDFVYGKGWDINEDGAITNEANVLPFNRWRLIHQRNFIQQPSCFFRRDLISHTGVVDEDLHYVMDWDLWIRFSAFNELYLDKHLSYNRTYTSNKTQSGQFKRWREIRAMIRRYTIARWPPVLTLYYLEALIQYVRTRAVPGKIENALLKTFYWGMLRELSGHYSDGSISPRFAFTVGNPFHRNKATLTITPLSAYDRSRLGASPVKVSWLSSSNLKGTFTILENGAVQQFDLPLGQHRGFFVHFSCQAHTPGVEITGDSQQPSRRIAAFLDRIQV